jgi:hypothetical protein
MPRTGPGPRPGPGRAGMTALSAYLAGAVRRDAQAARSELWLS